nr:NAD-binding protein [Microlunatus panaciterrae]
MVKLLNNLMFGAINAITAETMGAAAHLGLDPGLYYTTLAESGAASVSNLFKEIAPKMVAGDWSPAFTIDLLAKDNRLALAMIEGAGLEPPVAQAVVRANAAAQAAGLGSLDTSAMVRLLEARQSPE